MWAVVINPISGEGKGATYGTRVITFFNSRGIDYRIVTGATANLTSKNLSTFLSQEQKCDGVVAVGGDGLVHLVIQQLAQTNIPLAVIPAGTGNDTCRTLGWPLDNLEYILQSVLTKDPQYIDLGIVDGEWFSAILSTGFDSVVNERANTFKWPKGPMKYNAAIARELPGFKPREYEIELDGRTYSTRAMLIAVGNGISYGGGMKVCPNAVLHDGLFDVMILHPISKVEFLRVFPKVYSGAHVSHPAVKFFRSKRVAISSNAIAYADGERVGPLPIHAESVPSALLTWLQ
ncbi:MAG: YegS/Rv2252/BmrU family lipid kinase [Candidatus Nanopelagicaceae bacterium]|nr:YegS/Rv2252/BmrU family lipid kinase [Candidatus Nanopelagicaceae bacterium]